jgi:glycosyltransferase involved in cell wall biosynthesis
MGKRVSGYLVSGIGPGPGGVGRFMDTIIPIAGRHGYRVIWRPEKHETGRFRFVFRRIRYYSALWRIKGKDVIVIHPQSLRWKEFFKLLSTNRVGLYVVDNSFFCIRSYNYREGDYAECLDCLGSLNRCHESCLPFPVFYPKDQNLAYLRQLAKISSEIRFICQNRGQESLVREHFGPHTRTGVVGMVTDEFSAPAADEGVSPSVGVPDRYDVVYHGALVPAKGVQYVLELAKRLSGLSFLIPGREVHLRNIMAGEDLPANVVVKEMTWETGLKAHVEMCRVVLCPSLWSAPVEGALIKSLMHNGRVAVFNTRHGFQAEIPGQALLRLDDDLDESADRLSSYLEEDVDAGLVKDYLRELRKKTDLDAIFEGSSGKE